MYTTYKVYLPLGVLYTNQSFPVRIGGFGTDGSLTEITDLCNFEALTNTDTIFINDNTFLTTQNVTYYCRANYNGTYIYFSLFPQIPLVFPNTENIYTIFKQEEPPSVYTQSRNVTSLTYLDNYAFATLMAQSYQEVQSLIDNFYPETGMPAWEYNITGFNNIYPPHVNYQPIVQFLRNLNVNQSLNPYDMAFAISKYIFLRTGLNLFVYIEEGHIDLKNTWILGVSKLGINTTLSSESPTTRDYLYIHVFLEFGVLSSEVKFEVQWLINKITRASVVTSVDFDKTPEEYGLIYELLDVYKGDPQLNKTYCLQYTEGNLEFANALINPIDPFYLTSISFIPPTAALPLHITFPLVVYGQFIGGYEANITNLVSFVNGTPEYVTLTGTVIQTIALGEALLEASINNGYQTFYAFATYNISIINEWIVGLSQLGTNTILA